MMELSKKNAKMLSRMGPRAVYGLTLLELATENDKVYALSADLGGSSGMSRLMAEMPERYINVGIAEQNLIGVSAGFASEGLVPFASSFAPFITCRCYDQIRMNMGYMHLNIKTVGLGSGISMSILGNSHYGTTDIALMSAIPGMTILSPCDCGQLAKCIRAAAKFDGPVYIRLTGEPGMPVVYEDEFDYTIGKAITLKNGSDVLIIATGSMVRCSLDAAQILETKGIDVAIVDMHTIKPLDVSVIEKKFKMIVVVEEHSEIGGLGSMIASYTAQEGGFGKVVSLSIPDSYPKAGAYGFMLDTLGLNSEMIAEKIENEYKGL